jgi:Zn-dependent membrane protease YugP
MFFFDPIYLLFIAPALILAFIAQTMVRSAYNEMLRVPARMSGYEAARRILDSNGLNDIRVEQVPGELSDHYDPSARLLRLSPSVFQGNSMASVGIAAHEAGHAIQHARHYAPLVVRNMAVPAANIGGSLGMILLMVGIGMTGALGASSKLGGMFILAGIVGFGATVVFQLINLPVEFDASARAKTELVNLGIIKGPELPNVQRVLNAAALTYVAATLQSVMILAYYVFRFLLASQSQD